MSRRGAPTGAVLLAVLLPALGLFPGPVRQSRAADVPAPAPPPAAPAPPPEPRILTLAGQSPFAQPDGSLQLSLSLTEPPDGLTVQVVIHRAVTSRSEFGQALAARTLGAVEGRMSVAASDLPANQAGQLVLTLGVDGPASATALPDPARIVPGRSGVYPTELELLRGGDVVDRFLTPLVVIAAGLSPLTLAWVWPFDATPAHEPDGTIRPEAAEALGPAGRLGDLARAAATSSVPLTLAPTPETLVAWQAAAREEERQPGGPPAEGAATGLAALQTAAANPGHQVLRSPFVPFDMPALLEAELREEADAQFARGARDHQEVLGALPPAPFTLLAPGPLDNAALGRLRQYGAERFVFPAEALEPRDHRLTPGRPFAVGRGRLSPGAVTDPELGRLLDGEDPPALRAARFLAGLSLVALEAPGEPRGVVVVMPPEWDPPASLLDGVLVGLKDNPAVVPATIDGYFSTVEPEGPDGRPVVRELAAERPPEPDDAETLRELRRQLAALSGVVEPGSDWLALVDRTILLSRATALGAEDRNARTLPSPAAYLEGADRHFEEITAKVRGPRGQRVTLTSRRATIPISLLNATGQPLHVRIRLKSDQLRFLDGAERFVTLASQNTTEVFRVESRATGAFPLEISVTSPDGLLRIDESELTIRSTVVSGVGAVLTAGAGLFLLVWWGNDLRRSRRRRNGRARRQGRIAAKAAARALDDSDRVITGTG